MNISIEKVDISVVIPIKDEAGSIKELIYELLDVLREMGESYEIIVVDDGSTDGSREVLGDIPGINTIFFDRNYGQSSALDAGIKSSLGEFVITMDGDGQNSPADIPVMFKTLKEKDLNALCGRRRDRRDRAGKKVAAYTGFILRKIILGDDIKDSGCTLKVVEGSTFRSLDLFAGMHRFIPALLEIKGKKVDQVDTDHRPRMRGKTKYNSLRFFQGLVDLFAIFIIKGTKENKRGSLVFVSLFFFIFVVLGGFSLWFLDDPLSRLLFLFLFVLVLWFLSGVLANIRCYYDHRPRYRIEASKGSYSGS